MSQRKNDMRTTSERRMMPRDTLAIACEVSVKRCDTSELFGMIAGEENWTRLFYSSIIGVCDGAEIRRGGSIHLNEEPDSRATQTLDLKNVRLQVKSEKNAVF